MKPSPDRYTGIKYVLGVLVVVIVVIGDDWNVALT
jgi:hypothetical protein